MGFIVVPRSLATFEVLTPPKIVFNTLIAPSIVGNTLLLTIDSLTVVPVTISLCTPVGLTVSLILSYSIPKAEASDAANPAPNPDPDVKEVIISFLTTTPLFSVGITLLLTIDSLTLVPCIISFSTFVPLKIVSAVFVPWLISGRTSSHLNIVGLIPYWRTGLTLICVFLTCGTTSFLVVCCSTF